MVELSTGLILSVGLVLGTAFYYLIAAPIFKSPPPIGRKLFAKEARERLRAHKSSGFKTVSLYFECTLLCGTILSIGWYLYWLWHDQALANSMAGPLAQGTEGALFSIRFNGWVVVLASFAWSFIGPAIALYALVEGFFFSEQEIKNLNMPLPWIIWFPLIALNLVILVFFSYIVRGESRFYLDHLTDVPFWALGEKPYPYSEVDAFLWHTSTSRAICMTDGACIGYGTGFNNTFFEGGKKVTPEEFSARMDPFIKEKTGLSPGAPSENGEGGPDFYGPIIGAVGGWVVLLYLITKLRRRRLMRLLPAVWKDFAL